MPKASSKGHEVPVGIPLGDAIGKSFGGCLRQDHVRSRELSGLTAEIVSRAGWKDSIDVFQFRFIFFEAELSGCALAIESCVTISKRFLWLLSFSERK